MKIRNIILICAFLIFPINLLGMNLINQCRSIAKSLCKKQQKKLCVNFNCLIEEDITLIKIASVKCYNGAQCYCHQSKLEMAKSLISKGVNLDTKNNEGITALMQAVIYNNIDMVELFLENGADPNLQDNFGDTALLYATSICSPNIEIIKLLIKFGTNLDIKNKSGETALCNSLIFETFNVTELLIMNGANTDSVMDDFKIEFSDFNNNCPSILARCKSKLKAEIIRKIPVDPLCDIIVDYVL